MPDGSLPLLVGTLIALLALSYVLLPLLDAGDAPAAPPVRAAGRVDDDAGLASAALREIEFDRETGKLSDADYAELKAKYARLAEAEARTAAGVDGRAGDAPLALVATAAASAVAPGEDPVEAAVRAVQARRPSCPSCGPRPESDATWCSGCGGYLPGACQACGADVPLPGARFCSGCGVPLAA
jgi:hypothetical protein